MDNSHKEFISSLSKKIKEEKGLQGEVFKEILI